MTDSKRASALKGTRLFLLLLVYSLLPGVAKALDHNAIFAANILVILALLHGMHSFSWTRWDRPLLLFAAWTLLYVPLAYLVVPGVDARLLVLGAYLFLVPMTGFLVAKGYRFSTFTKALAAVGLSHVFLGFLTYGFLPLPEWVQSIREGTMAFRMASVSGSLAFSALAVLTFVALIGLAAQQPRRVCKSLLLLLATVTFVAVVLSLQRGAWLAVGAALGALALARDGTTSRLALRVTVLLAALVAVTWPVSSSLLDSSIITARLESLLDTRSEEGAIGERSAMWQASLGHVISAPLGLGLGQVGQANRIADREGAYSLVVDGDYFKIAAETGIPGILLLLYLLACLGLSFRAAPIASPSGVATSALVALLIQMTGTNVSELYFVNFLLWALCGYMLAERAKAAVATVPLHQAAVSRNL